MPQAKRENGKFIKRSKSEFVNKANIVHLQKYNYEKVEYIKSTEKVEILCSIHGSFFQTPKAHIQGQGCPECGKIVSSTKRKNRPKKLKEKPLSLKQKFILKAEKIHEGKKYDYTNVDYINYKTSVKIICPIHGEFTQSPASHLQTSGCKACASEKVRLAKRDTLESFIKKSKITHKNHYDYTAVKYKTSKSKVEIICPKHGSFFQLAGQHILGKGCKQCAIEETAKLNKKETWQFVEEANKIHENTYLYSNTEYIGALKKVSITCKVHGDFEQRPSDHLAGSGCPLCAKTQSGWTHTAWEKAGELSKNFEAYQLYIIKCFNEEEEFIKIGKTFNSISKRFASSSMPYEWVKVYILEGSAKYISTYENTLQRMLKKYSYTPKLPFGGDTECFSVGALDSLHL